MGNDQDVPGPLVLDELARLVASAQLRRAPQLQRLLSHIVHATLGNDTSRLREINLALECFGRSASRFDPREDSSVRVAANRLRHRLAAYYADTDTNPAIRIELPVGTYIPVFRRQRPLVGRAVSAVNEAMGREPQRSADPAAQDLYDRGRFALRQQNAAGYRKAIELFERATDRDPSFASAWAARSMAWLGLVGWLAAPTLPSIETARQAAMRALELDPGQAQALASLASIIHRYDFNFAAAEPLYRQAIALDPASRYAHHGYAFALMLNARFDDAAAEYSIALELDPLDQALRCQQALIPIYTGRYGEAESTLLRILEVDEENVLARSLLGATYLYSGQPGRALSAYQHLIDRMPNLSIGWCGRAQALAAMGLRRKARLALDAMIRRTGAETVSPYQVAMVHARLGDGVAALAWLDRAATQRDANFVCASLDPTFAGLRRLDGWRALMQKHGLAPAPVTPPSRSSRGSAACRRRCHA